MRANLTIRKTPQDLRLTPHLADYARERQAFSWTGAAHALQGLPAGGLNLGYEAVAEAAAIGVPLAGGGEVIKAFVSLEPGREPDEALRLDLLEHARRRLGVEAAPRAIAFVQALPRTASGTLLHRLLRARELGLPEGDASALTLSD